MQSKHNLIDGIVFGRVDYVGSLGLSRNDIESGRVTRDVLTISEKCKEINMDFVVGGAVSYDAKENLNLFLNSYLSRFETRKVIFNGDALTKNTLEST